MPRNETYNTKQKEMILSIIKKKNHPFTIKELYQELNGEVGLTTIYRLIDKMLFENKLNKSISHDNITFYELLKECQEENHFYLKCTKCRDLVHIDCDCIEGLFNHITKEHQFKPDKEHIIIEGTCQKCQMNGNGGI